MGAPVAELRATFRAAAHERRFGQLAPGSQRLETGAVRCGACGLVATTPHALRLHRTPDGQCLDPRTDRGPRGAALMLPAAELGDGIVVWGWPDKRRASRVLWARELGAGG